MLEVELGGMKHGLASPMKFEGRQVLTARSENVSAAKIACN